MAKLFGKEKDLTKEREEKVVPVARKIIKLIIEAELPMGSIHAHDNPKFAATAKEVLGLMLEVDMKYVDKDYLSQVILQPFDSVMEIVKRSLGESFNNAEKKVFGKDFRDLTLGDLDKVLKG